MGWSAGRSFCTSYPVSDWAVTTKVVPLLGAVEDRSSGTQGARHHLIVKGAVAADPAIWKN